MMACKGICSKYKAKSSGTGNKLGKYANGQFRCQQCEIFIKWEGRYCPCCGVRLRTKPRNKIYKALLKAKTNNIPIEY